MNIVCISASNIKHSGENSTSFKVCRLIQKLINRRESSDIEISIVSLKDFELIPCIGCGGCYKADKCHIDNDFNKVYHFLCKADALFIVSAHYAPIPSKLSMLLEKIEQLAFLKKFNDENYRSPLYGKPVGIVGHGGGTEGTYKYYKTPVIDSIWNALSYPIEMNVIGIDDEQPRGVIFPVKKVTRVEDSIFPVQEYDWPDIEKRVSPLINNVLEKLEL